MKGVWLLSVGHPVLSFIRAVARIGKVKDMGNKAICTFVVLASALALPAQAAECALSDRPCIIESLRASADKIETPAWRDQTYRELAKTLAFEGNIDGAIALIDKIETPDTKAMTIRGIGMAAADNKLTPERYAEIFQKLRASADKIVHPPSYAIALTYIAMAQAFAGDNEGAWKTAADMENVALRHKAYGETAEIQAERGDFDSCMKSIDLIGAASFRNKSYETVSKIFADSKRLDEALRSAQMITNPYKKASALQYVLDKQKPREVAHLKHEDMETLP
jgi:hypothetical protein